LTESTSDLAAAISDGSRRIAAVAQRLFMGRHPFDGNFVDSAGRVVECWGLGCLPH